MAVPVAALLASAAAAAVDYAKKPENREKMVNAAKFVWDNKDEIEAGVKDAAQTAAPVAKKAAGAGAAAGAKAAGIFGAAAAGVAKAAKGASESATETIGAATERRAQEKAVAEARQRLLQGALSKMAVADFVQEWERTTETPAPSSLAIPGYFVIATYKGKPNDGKLSDYKSVFVARSDNMGASVYGHLNGAGDPDVYADAKYGQAMLVFLFPDFDTEDDDNETLCQFIQALGADESYNARYGGVAEGSLVQIVATGSTEAVGKAIESMGASACAEELVSNGVARVVCRLD